MFTLHLTNVWQIRIFNGNNGSSERFLDFLFFFLLPYKLFFILFYLFDFFLNFFLFMLFLFSFLFDRSCAQTEVNAGLIRKDIFLFASDWCRKWLWFCWVISIDGHNFPKDCISAIGVHFGVINSDLFFSGNGIVKFQS